MQVIGRGGRKVLKSTLPFALLFATGGTARATVSISPNPMNFGGQAVGVASKPMAVTLTNNGPSKIKIVSISLSLSQFVYSGPSPPVVLYARQSLVASVTFRPTAAKAYQGTLVFTGGNGASFTVNLSGTGIQSPSVIGQPTNQIVTAGQTATFSVTAFGTAPLNYQWKKNGTAISGATSASYTTPATTTADNGAQFTVVVSNSAGSVTSSAASLTVNPAAGPLAASASTLTFGSVNVGSSRSLSTNCTNSGSSSITVSSVIISGAGFTVSGVSKGQIITPGQVVTLNVTFAPAATGSVTGSVTVASNASNSPATIGLSGTGVQATVTSITVTPANPTIAVGAQLQFKAVNNLGNDITSSVIWASSDTSMATITAGGLATGRATGSLTITATY
jgi:hypothetical protein